MCSCCNVDRPDGEVAALKCHSEVKVCRVCVGWLREQVGGVDFTAILPVRDMGEAKAFYEAAGFDIEVSPDGDYAIARLGGQNAFEMSIEVDMDGSANRAGVYATVPVVDEWHSMLVELGYPVTDPVDEDSGMREFTLTLIVREKSGRAGSGMVGNARGGADFISVA